MNNCKKFLFIFKNYLNNNIDNEITCRHKYNSPNNIHTHFFLFYAYKQLTLLDKSNHPCFLELKKNNINNYFHFHKQVIYHHINSPYIDTYNSLATIKNVTIHIEEIYKKLNK